MSARCDWLATPPAAQGDDDSLPPALRSRLLAEWTRAAQLEHASVASFARFTLELLALGAPAELVEQAGRAMADEIEHAKLCFALASRYAGRPLGPGPLALDGALGATDLESVTLAAVIEGCVGETLAALEAAEAAEHTTDPDVRGVLLRIADDETRHAELAWRFVRWALERGDARSAERVHEAFAGTERDLARRPVPAPQSGDEALLAAGVLPERHRHVLRVRGFREVVLVCARALLSVAGGGSPASLDVAA